MSPLHPPPPIARAPAACSPCLWSAAAPPPRCSKLSPAAPPLRLHPTLHPPGRSPPHHCSALPPPPRSTPTPPLPPAGCLRRPHPFTSAGSHSRRPAAPHRLSPARLTLLRPHRSPCFCPALTLSSKPC
eukprot:58469-Prymnesium_polylepis.1